MGSTKKASWTTHWPLVLNLSSAGIYVQKWSILLFLSSILPITGHPYFQVKLFFLDKHLSLPFCLVILMTIPHLHTISLLNISSIHTHLRYLRRCTLLILTATSGLNLTNKREGLEWLQVFECISKKQYLQLKQTSCIGKGLPSMCALLTATSGLNLMKKRKGG